MLFEAPMKIEAEMQQIRLLQLANLYLGIDVLLRVSNRHSYSNPI